MSVDETTDRTATRGDAARSAMAARDLGRPRRVVTALGQRLGSRQVWLGAASIAVVIAIYAAVSNFASVNPVLVPTPQDIVSALVDGFRTGGFAGNVGASLLRVIVGFAIGTAAAVVIGSLLGWFKLLEDVFDPLVEAIRPIPPLAYIPLVIIWFGIGEGARVLVIALAAFLTCFVGAFSGMKHVPRVYVDAARTLGASEGRVFRTVALPSAVPYIFTGLRVALAASWTTLVAAELVAAQSGLGFLLENARRFFRTDVVIAAVIIIGVLAFVMDRVLYAASRYFTRWSDV